MKAQISRIHLEFLSVVGCINPTILRLRNSHVVTTDVFFEQYPRSKSLDSSSRDFLLKYINKCVYQPKGFVKIKSMGCHVQLQILSYFFFHSDEGRGLFPSLWTTSPQGGAIFIDHWNLKVSASEVLLFYESISLSFNYISSEFASGLFEWWQSSWYMTSCQS